MSEQPHDNLESPAPLGPATVRGCLGVTLPDGSRREFPQPVTGNEIAAAIGPGLAKAAIAIRIDGKPRDLATVVGHDAAVAVITRDMPDGLEILRHDAAHVMAEAVKELYPDTQVTFGPATETGFYYDFARGEPFTPTDLEKIEARMREIVRRDEKISREVWSRRKAIGYFRKVGERYKAEHIRDIPKAEEISVYRQGGFVDLCRGPHLPSTGRLGQAFKLMNVAGAYWRGDSKNASCSASMAPPGRTRRTSTYTSSGSKKPSGAIIAASGASSSCSTWARKRSAASFGIQKGGRCFASSRITCGCV